MSIEFFIIGGIIFLIYVYLTIWNIYYSGKKQKQENYPKVDIEEETKKSLSSNL